ncbi:hypothetical protein THARTR1_09173 [Trichoderma harzianum]|uniref:Peptidase S8/S53 domain-containing protein n=1 Tax=Trichoderma harzianum TaxID=5544 RepID=A0A2K0TXE9_TRIHA|nr:hypothetical protein THARTR1_09173 [Trichoderma harzianum]
MSDILSTDESEFEDDVDLKDEPNPRLITKWQKDLMRRLLEGDPTFRSEDEIRRTSEEIHLPACLKSGTEGTLLHMLLENVSDSSFGDLRPLMRVILDINPSSLEDKNPQGETVLHYSIQRRLSRVTKFLCEHSTRAKQAISDRGPYLRNCLHTAISRELDNDVVLYLVDICDDVPGKEQDDGGRTPLHLAANYPNCKNAKQIDVRIQQELDAQKIEPEEPSSRTSSLGRDLLGNIYGTRRRRPKRTKVERVEDARVQAEAIQTLMKTFYLDRCTSRQESLKYLFKGSPTREIEFDLQGATSLTKEMLNNMAELLNFETVLAYVNLPSFPASRPKVEQEPLRSKRKRQNRSAQHPEQLLGRGRRDFLLVFEWLREQGVKKILRVTANDDINPGHGDEVIEQALKTFDVETWDWRRSDICSETIISAAPNAKIVHIYSSGNNSALREWSAPDGLVRLEKLEKLHLHMLQGFESFERTLRNAHDFLERIYKSTESLGRKSFETTWNFRDEQESTVNTTNVKTSKMSWIEDLKTLRDFLVEDVPAKPHSRRIKVALIDDSIDVSQDIFDGALTGGQSFSEDKGKVMPWYVSSPTSHGTIMAKTICEYAPNLSLFIARVDNDAGQRTFDGVQQAMHWAIESKVDIICIGRPIPIERDAEEAQLRLRSSLDLARASGIVVLGASSSTTGPRAASLDFREIIQIFSESSTRKEVFHHAVHFCIPGSFSPRSLKDEKSDERHRQTISDDDAAIALACALAVSIISIAEQSKSAFNNGSDIVRAGFQRLVRDQERVIEIRNIAGSIEKWWGSDDDNDVGRLLETLASEHLGMEKSLQVVGGDQDLPEGSEQLIELEG